MAVGAGLAAGVDLRVGSDFGELETSPRQSGIAIPSALADFFLFAMTLLGAESSSSLLSSPVEAAEPL